MYILVCIYIEFQISKENLEVAYTDALPKSLILFIDFSISIVWGNYRSITCLQIKRI